MKSITIKRDRYVNKWQLATYIQECFNAYSPPTHIISLWDSCKFPYHNIPFDVYIWCRSQDLERYDTRCDSYYLGDEFLTQIENSSYNSVTEKTGLALHEAMKIRDGVLSCNLRGEDYKMSISVGLALCKLIEFEEGYINSLMDMVNWRQENSNPLNSRYSVLWDDRNESQKQCNQVAGRQGSSSTISTITEVCTQGDNKGSATHCESADQTVCDNDG